MQLKGYTQIGFFTGILIICFHLLLIKMNWNGGGLIGLQFLILLAGIFYSVYLYNKNNKLYLLDLFMIGFRTLSAAIILILIAQVIFYYTLPHNSELTLTMALMPMVFTLGFSGALSAFISALIVNKLMNSD